MEDFFEELEAVLKKHNAAILRSANDEHSLVVSIGKDFMKFYDFSFEEDITSGAIHYGKYKQVFNN